MRFPIPPSPPEGEVPDSMALLKEMRSRWRGVCSLVDDMWMYRERGDRALMASYAPELREAAESLAGVVAWWCGLMAAAWEKALRDGDTEWCMWNDNPLDEEEMTACFKELKAVTNVVTAMHREAPKDDNAQIGEVKGLCLTMTQLMVSMSNDNGNVNVNGNGNGNGNGNYGRRYDGTSYGNVNGNRWSSESRDELAQSMPSRDRGKDAQRLNGNYGRRYDVDYGRGYDGDGVTELRNYGFAESGGMAVNVYNNITYNYYYNESKDNFNQSIVQNMEIKDGGIVIIKGDNIENGGIKVVKNYGQACDGQGAEDDPTEDELRREVDEEVREAKACVAEARGDIAAASATNTVTEGSKEKESFIVDMKMLVFETKWENLGALYDEILALGDKKQIPALVKRYIIENKLSFKETKGMCLPCFKVMTKHQLYQMSIATWNRNV